MAMSGGRILIAVDAGALFAVAADSQEEAGCTTAKLEEEIAVLKRKIQELEWHKAEIVEAGCELAGYVEGVVKDEEAQNLIEAFESSITPSECHH